MGYDAFSPTREEIRLVQELAPGWEVVWEKIATELLGYDGEGRLAQAVRFLRLPLQKREDFVAFVMCEFQARVCKGKLLAGYDSEHPKADVYKFICNYDILKQAYTSFKREYLPFRGRLSRVEDKDKDGESVPLETIFESHYREMSNTIRDNLESLISRLCEGKLALRLPDKNKFDRVHEQAGLQLYPRLNDMIETVGRLINHVHDSVRKANVLHTEPAHTIKREHQEAEERIESQAEKYSAEIARNVQPRARDDIRRKTQKLGVERYFYPLDTEQRMRLLNLERNNADQIHSRYMKRLSQLLSFSKEDEEILQELGILNEEGGEDD